MMMVNCIIELRRTVMSKYYEWWIEQICIQCNETNEFCQCINDYPTEAIGEENE